MPDGAARCAACGGVSLFTDEGEPATEAQISTSREAFGASDDAIVGDPSFDADEWESFEGNTDSFLRLATGEVLQFSLRTNVYVDQATAAKLEPAAVLKPSGDTHGPLSPFEEHVLRFVDGARPVLRVAKKAGLSEEDVRIALAMLLEKGAVLHVGRTERPVSRDEPEPAIDRAPATPASAPQAATKAAVQRTPFAVELPKVPPAARAKEARAPAVPLDVQLYEDAQRAERGGLYDEAIRLLHEALALNPNAAALYNRLGIILATRKKAYRRAILALERAAALEPENQTIRNNLVKVLAAAPDSEKSEPEKHEDLDGPVRVRRVNPKRW